MCVIEKKFSLFPPTKSDGHIALVSVRQCVRTSVHLDYGFWALFPFFNSIYLKPSMCSHWLSVQNWPSSGPRIIENGGFRPLSEKLCTQSNWNLVCSLIWWVSKNDSNLVTLAQFRPAGGAQITYNGDFRPLSIKGITQPTLLLVHILVL